MVAQIDVGTPLKNAKHEQFARAMARGDVCIEAYLKIFNCKRNSAEVLAWKLSRNVKVALRIQQIQAAATSKTVLSILEIREFHADLLRCSVNKLSVDSPLITRIKRRKLSEEDGGGVIEEIWVADKLKAAETELKLMGALNDSQAGLTINNQTIMVVLPGEIMEPRRVVRRLEQGQE